MPEKKGLTTLPSCLRKLQRLKKSTNKDIESFGQELKTAASLKKTKKLLGFVQIADICTKVKKLPSYALFASILKHFSSSNIQTIKLKSPIIRAFFIQNFFLYDICYLIQPKFQPPCRFAQSSTLS